MIEQTGRLVIVANRGGTIAEISAFLSDVENAYIALYSFEKLWFSRRLWHRDVHPAMLNEWRYSLNRLEYIEHISKEPEMIPPSERLSLERIHIESPGFWEFAASLNPLKQLREYLNDRHRRRQDREYREEAEKERLVLDNILIQQQIRKGHITETRKIIKIMRELGYTDDEIRQIVWSQLGIPLSQLGRHQDSRLINGAECKIDSVEE